jgi:hypothetical protein
MLLAVLLPEVVFCAKADIVVTFNATVIPTANRVETNKPYHQLYKFSTDKGFELVCPVSEIYNHTSSDRLQLINFYDSELGQAIYSWRSISVEPLIVDPCLSHRFVRTIMERIIIKDCYNIECR